VPRDTACAVQDISTARERRQRDARCGIGNNLSTCRLGGETPSGSHAGRRSVARGVTQLRRARARLASRDCRIIRESHFCNAVDRRRASSVSTATEISPCVFPFFLARSQLARCLGDNAAENIRVAPDASPMSLDLQ